MTGPDRTDSDEALIARARAGDEGAFEHLFDRHAGAVEGKIRKALPAVMNRRLSVADVLQEVRIVAFDKIADVEGRDEGALRRWLMRIAEYKVGSAMKRHLYAAKRAAGAEVSRGARADTGHFRGPGPSPSQHAQTSEERQLVRDALSLLPEDYARVLTLVFEQQLTLREAGEQMERSREATKKLYGRALARFTKILDQEQSGRQP